MATISYITREELREELVIALKPIVERLDGVEERLDRLETKVDRIETKLDGLIKAVPGANPGVNT